MTGTIAPERPFQQVDPLIVDPPRPAAAELFTLPPIGFRPDIEGLRALAVMLVVLFHADLGPFGGGFIGVDVFFVVSGFLITSLLLGEVARTGTVSLAGFWARRARRLLPASCVVIVATLLAAQLLYDPLLLGDLAREAVAACGFVVNFLFAAREAGGDGATSTPSWPSPRSCTSGRWPSRSSSTSSGRSDLIAPQPHSASGVPENCNTASRVRLT